MGHVSSEVGVWLGLFRVSWLRLMRITVREHCALGQGNRALGFLRIESEL